MKQQRAVGSGKSRKAQGDDKREVLTVDEVAERLGVTRLTAYSYIRRGTIPSLRPGGRRIMVPKDALKKLLAGAAPKAGQAGQAA